MKKTGGVHLFRTIRKNLVSFIAVAFIAAVSIAIYIGLQAGANATFKAADSYFKENKLETMEVMSASGLSSADLAEISKWENVDIVEGGYTTTVKMLGEDENVILQAISLTEKLNIPNVLEGSLPKSVDEVAIEQIFADEFNINVGDSIKLEHYGKLCADTFTVSAIINQPSFCCAKVPDTRGTAKEGLGTASYYIQFDKSAFNSAVYGGFCTVARIRCDYLDDYYYYSDEYREQEDKLLARYEKLAKEYAPNTEWKFSVRRDIGDLRAIEVLVESIYNLSYVISFLFVVVSILVCHAAIERMISEQKRLIGAQKALGFKSSEILGHFMLYNTICAVLGIAFGIIIGIFIVENVVVNIFASEYLFEKISLIFPWKQCIIAAVVCLAVFLATTYFACCKLVKKSSIELLRGDLPYRKKGFFFEKLKIYQKLKLYSKTMIKNVLNDKGRMINTIVGVVGCISLLVMCFSLKMAIENASKTQLGDYFLFENRLVIDTGSGEIADFENVLIEEKIEYAPVQDKLKAFRADGGDWDSARILTAKDSKALDGFVVLEDVKSGEKIDLPKDGALVSRKCAEIYDLSEGSTVEFINDMGVPVELKIVGVMEHYLSYHQFVTSDSYYQETFGTDADTSVFLLKGDISEISDKVKDIEGFLSLKDTSDFELSANQVDMVIGLCLALAVILAFLVLLNQINMYINRKAVELAVMRINGYTLKETKAYIYKDNIVLTVLGLIFGSVAGIALSYMVIRVIEGEVNRYVRTPNMLACLISSAVGAMFALIVNIIALRRINKLNLTNVNGN